MIPALGMVILPQNPSTENGHVPGCSCILSVVYHVACVISSLFFHQALLGMEDKIMPLLDKYSSRNPRNNGRTMPPGFVGETVLHNCALLAGVSVGGWDLCKKIVDRCA